MGEKGLHDTLERKKKQKRKYAIYGVVLLLVVNAMIFGSFLIGRFSMRRQREAASTTDVQPPTVPDPVSLPKVEVPDFPMPPPREKPQDDEYQDDLAPTPADPAPKPVEPHKLPDQQPAPPNLDVLRLEKDRRFPAMLWDLRLARDILQNLDKLGSRNELIASLTTAKEAFERVLQWVADLREKYVDIRLAHYEHVASLGIRDCIEYLPGPGARSSSDYLIPYKVKEPCSHCAGKGGSPKTKRCPRCRDSGLVRCLSCSGRGYLTNPISGNQYSCRSCSGTGKAKCSRCGSDGLAKSKRACHDCKAKGFVWVTRYKRKGSKEVEKAPAQEKPERQDGDTVTLLLKNGNEVTGELVKEDPKTVTILTEYGIEFKFDRKEIAEIK